jgi:hypothetical protein
MNNQINVIVLLIALITIIPPVSAQLFLGEEANQKSIEVTVDKSEIVHVKHIIYSSNSPGNVNLFGGIEEESLIVTNEEGEVVEIGKIGNDVEGLQTIVIFSSDEDSIIEYNLKDVSILNNNMWTVKLEYSKTFSILFSEEIDSFFLNNNLIQLRDQKGILVNNGGDINLQYYSKIPKITQEVKWEENKFEVEIITDAEINNFNFEQTSKSISFQINEKNKIVTLTMEEELLGGPYVIFLDNEKIQYTKSIPDKNHISLSIKPESTGEITIIGTTVIPEFPIFAPLAIGFLIILTLPLMRKFSLH